MIYIKYLILIAVSLVLSFLDISFFSFLDVYGATLLSSFIFLIIFTFVDKTKKDYIIVALSLVLSFSIFSSLPLFPIFINFFFIPAMISYLRRYYLPQPSLIVSVLYFLATTFIFEGVLLIYAKAWNNSGLLTFSWFIFINTVLGIIAYAFYLKVRRKFKTFEIKI